MPILHFQIDAWTAPDKHHETVATSCNFDVARAAFEAAKAAYSMRLTLRDRMQVLDVREDTVTGAGAHTQDGFAQRPE